MDLYLSIVIILIAFCAGLIGATFGLGGGIIIIPALTIFLGFPIKEVIGASLIGVIASSTGSAYRYVGDGLVNIRLGIMLEPATTLGSIIGASIAIYLNQVWLSAAFGLILLYTAYSMLREHPVSKVGKRCSSDLTCEYVDCQTGERVVYDCQEPGQGIVGELRGRKYVRPAWHRWGPDQGPCHEPLDGCSYTGRGRHEQLHDRSNGTGRSYSVLCERHDTACSGSDRGDRGVHGVRHWTCDIEKDRGADLEKIFRYYHDHRRDADVPGGNGCPVGVVTMHEGSVHQHTRLEKWIRRALFIGMSLSASTLVIGLILYSLIPSNETIDLSIPGIVNGIDHGNPVAIIDLGIVFLILTPLTRVITSLFVFIIDRELKFVILTMIVLGVIWLAVII